MCRFFQNLVVLFVVFMLTSCGSDKKKGRPVNRVHVAGAMKDVMWKGALGASIDLDTITGEPGLYGLGPESYLRGELLITDGLSYVSRVQSDSSMLVEQTSHVSAPFFVFAQVPQWKKYKLPSKVKTIRDLESYLDEKTKGAHRPFAFKLDGVVSRALIHCQNLPPGSVVSSPAEAHKGQTNYELKEMRVEIIGFFSTDHQGIFTHHDSYMHMHLITEDKGFMGHLDELLIKKMLLYLPKP